VSAATLRQAKAMGGVGSILVLLTPFLALASFATPTIIFSGLINIIYGIGLIGFVLILVAAKRISDAVNDKKIFNNVLKAVIIQIVGVVIVTIAAVIAGLLTILVSPNITSNIINFAVLRVLVVTVIGIWIVLIVSVRFLRKGYERIAAKTGTETFRSVGRWYFYGALLAIILVGFVLILIAWILQIVAFFSLPESPPSQPAPQVQTI
jgi:uncharacterized membrane protein